MCGLLLCSVRHLHSTFSLVTKGAPSYVVWTSSHKICSEPSAMPHNSVLNSLAIFAIQGGIGSLLFIVERFGGKAAMTQVLSAPCAMIHHSPIFVRRKTQIGTCLADKDAPAICFSAPSLKDNLGVVVIAVALVFCLLVVDPRH